MIGQIHVALLCYSTMLAIFKKLVGECAMNPKCMCLTFHICCHSQQDYQNCTVEGHLVWPLTCSKNVEVVNNWDDVMKVLWLKAWLAGHAQVVMQRLEQ